MQITVRGPTDYTAEVIIRAIFGKSLEEAAKDFIREERAKGAEQEACLQGAYPAR